MTKINTIIKNRIHTLAILVLICVVFFQEAFTNQWLIEGSAANIHKIGQAILAPELTSKHINHILSGYQNIFLFAGVGLCLAVYIGLLLSYFAVRFRRFTPGKYIGISLRSLHEVVFMYLLMLIFGLNVYIAVIAIALSFSGNICKVFTDNFNQLTNHQFICYQNRGFSFLTNFFFLLFPSAFQSNVSYIIYRMECAVRSSVVLSYIGLAGLGFYLNMALSDLDFNSMFIYLYALLAFVICFSLLCKALLKVLKFKITHFISLFIPLSLLLIVVFIVLNFDSFQALFQTQNWSAFKRILSAFATLFNPHNTLYTPESLLKYGKYTLQTLSLGIVATVFLLILFTIWHIHFLYAFTKNNIIHKRLNNIVSIVSRSVPEVIFLTMLLFFMKPSIISGALALGIHNFGIVLKLLKDRLLNDYSTVFRQYSNRGLSATNLFFFVFFPKMGKDLSSLLFYRFEMMIKSSVIIGLLGSGGLGYLFRLEMSKFNYEAVCLITLIYIALFALLEFIGNQYRKNHF